MRIDSQVLKGIISVEKFYQDHLGKPVRIGGKHWIYFCKFHPDLNTPNFTVYFDGGYRCEACGENGGDVFAFHMKLTGHSFPNTMKALAEQYAPHLLSDNGNGHQNLPKKEVAYYDYKDESGKDRKSVV